MSGLLDKCVHGKWADQNCEECQRLAQKCQTVTLNHGGNLCPCGARRLHACPIPSAPSQQSANNTQVGGAHYQMPIQTWDYIAANGIGYFEGNIIKYVSRWQKKGGVEDLKKARHYLDKLIELEEGKTP